MHFNQYGSLATSSWTVYKTKTNLSTSHRFNWSSLIHAQFYFDSEKLTPYERTYIESCKGIIYL